MATKNASGVNMEDLRTKILRMNWLQHRRFAQQIADLHLTVPQFYTLSTLVQLNGQCNMGQLARETHQVSATMTGIVDRLVRDGLVERSRGEKDRRSVVVFILPAGRELVQAAIDRALAPLNEVLSALSPEERAVAHKLFDALTKLLED